MSDLAWMRPKLAELCGIEQRFGNEIHPHPNDESVFGWFDADGKFVCHRDSWRPDEDVGQAIRCLEALDLPTQINNTTHKPRKWLVSVWKDQDGCDAVDLEDGKLPRAICLAIASALAWEKP